MADANDHAEVLVSTTWSCNLRCSYCFVADQTHARIRPRMSAAEARRVIQSLDRGLAHYSTIGVHLYGGEPLTNLPALRALVDQAAQAPRGRFSFSITTNGTILSDEVFELLEAGRFQVVLSVDGPAPVHDQYRRTIRGAATHARTMRFLRELRARTHCWVRGSSVVRAGWRLADAQRYLRGLPVDVIKAQAVRTAPGDKLGLDGDEREQYLDDLDAAGDQVISDLAANRIPKDDRFSARVLQLLKGETRHRFCGAGASIFGVTPGGDVLPCVLLDRAQHRLGSVADQEHSWVGAGRDWQESHGPRNECGSCAALPLCGGGCPAMLSVCGAEECDLVRKTCSVAQRIHEHFRSQPTKLLALAGVV